MISTLLVWIYIFLLTTLAGHFIFWLSGIIMKKELKSNPSVAELSFSGMVIIGIFLGYFSLFYKIGLLANLIILSAGLIYFFSRKKSLIAYFKSRKNDFLQLPAIIKILIFIYFILLLFDAQLHPTIADTGLYHIQSIKWINSFKVIPGLGNLHGRLAYNNHSFLLEALFNFSFLKPDFFHLVNSYLLFILSATLIIHVQKNLKLDLKRALLYSGLLILLQVFYLKPASSPTPDIFSMAGIWFIFIIYFEKISREEGNQLFWIPLLLMVFFTVTVKLSAFPVILAAGLFLAESDLSLPKKLLWISFTGALVLIPFFIRNYFISGYLIYPYASINIFNPDWKMPAQYVREMKSIITTYAQAIDWKQRPISEWLPIWFSHLSRKFRIISCFILVSPVIISLIAIISGKIRKLFSSELKIAAICFFAIIFWFFSAPNFRFIYAFLFFYLLIACLIIADLFSDSFKKYEEKISSGLPKVLIILLILFPAWFIANFNYGELKKCTIFPAKLETVSYKSVKMNNFIVNIPNDSSTYCWNAPLPCTLFQNNIGVIDIKMRGNDLKYGFSAVEKK
ncbi:MAG: hypothetical protein ABSA76_04495 [Bacteroidales bacterium]